MIFCKLNFQFSNCRTADGKCANDKDRNFCMSIKDMLQDLPINERNKARIDILNLVQNEVRKMADNE